MRFSKYARRRELPSLSGWLSLLALLAVLLAGPISPAAGADKPRLVVVLYPDDNDGRPGTVLFNRGLRSTFASESSEPVDIHSEFLDVTRLTDPAFQQHLALFLRRKYEGRKIDLVIAGLASALDFTLKYRDQAFPGVPVVLAAVDRGVTKTRRLPPDVIGVPIKMDLEATLEIALRLHPQTQRVFVVTGQSPFDRQWEAEARRTFTAYGNRVEFVYLAGLPLGDLLKRVADLPERSILYYLHVFQDGGGKILIPADVAELLAAEANAPAYSHVGSYVGRGTVGGCVFSFETEGRNAARLGLRLLAGEKAETLGVQPTSENTYLFDARQLQRWGINETGLPAGSEVHHREPSFWDLYRWHIIGVISLCVVEALLIVGLLVQRVNRRRAEEGLRESQRELRELTGRLLLAQETERRRIARELHDDLNQSLALLSVELDLLGQRPPESAGQIGDRMHELSARVKQLSSSVHNLSHQLHPAKLEQLGLVAAVRSLSKELAQAHNLAIEFTHHEITEAIPEDTALCLFRITQEALRNVIKHSGARRASVELGADAGVLCLRIIDDGSGIDPRSANGQGGLGLVSMRERLRLVNGEILIHSQPLQGTRIEARVPLGRPGQDDSALKPQPAQLE